MSHHNHTHVMASPGSTHSTGPHTMEPGSGSHMMMVSEIIIIIILFIYLVG